MPLHYKGLMFAALLGCDIRSVGHICECRPHGVTGSKKSPNV